MTGGTQEEVTDETLVSRSKAGDDEAFASLIARHKERLLRLARRFARTSDELDDLAQEIFIESYRKLGQFRGEAPFAHWIARLAVRKCYDLLRRTRRERVHAVLPELLESFADPSSSAAWSASDARQLLEFAFARMAPEDRLVLTLLELDDRSVREVADLTSWSESKVKVRAFRARRHLADLLKNHDL